MSAQDGAMPPLLLFRSFLTIASGFVAHAMCLYVLMAVIGLSFFPEFAEFTQLDFERQKQIMETNPRSVVGWPMLWSVVGSVAVLTVVIGALVNWTAPFKPLVHVAFLAVILGVNYLQMGFSEGPGKKTMTVIYMMVFPAAMMIGGYWAQRRRTGEEYHDDGPVDGLGESDDEAS